MDDLHVRSGTIVYTAVILDRKGFLKVMRIMLLDPAIFAGDHPQQITHKKNNSTHHIQLPHHDAAVNQIFRGSRFFQ